jgi:hypothetical protein
VGQVTDGLNRPFIPGGTYLVKEKGKDNGRGKPEEEFEGTDDDGIPEYLPEAGHPEEALEVGKPHPGTAHNPQTEDKIFKGYLNPVHGTIAEYGIIGEGRQKEDNQIPVFPIESGQVTKFT